MNDEPVSCGKDRQSRLRIQLINKISDKNICLSTNGPFDGIICNICRSCVEHCFCSLLLFMHKATWESETEITEVNDMFKIERKEILSRQLFISHPNQGKGEQRGGSKMSLMDFDETRNILVVLDNIIAIDFNNKLIPKALELCDITPNPMFFDYDFDLSISYCGRDKRGVSLDLEIIHLGLDNMIRNFSLCTASMKNFKGIVCNICFCCATHCICQLVVESVHITSKMTTNLQQIHTDRTSDLFVGPVGGTNLSTYAYYYIIPGQVTPVFSVTPHLGVFMPYNPEPVSYINELLDTRPSSFLQHHIIDE